LLARDERAVERGGWPDYDVSGAPSARLTTPQLLFPDWPQHLLKKSSSLLADLALKR
jgi:hypothetical protein